MRIQLNKKTVDHYVRTCVLAFVIAVSNSAPALGQVVNEDFKITAVDGNAEHQFGQSLAIDQGVIAVGAPGDDDNGMDSGSAYLYDTSTGSQTAKLVPNDGAAGDEFGFSIAIGDGIVAVGAVRDEHGGITSGSAYLFNAFTGTQIVKLTPEDGEAGDEFGFAVAIDDGVVAVGAKRDDDNGVDAGAVYLFDATTGTQINKLLADDGGTNDNFGGAVAIDGGVVAIGAHADWVGPLFLAGSAYLFDVSTGDQLWKLVANNAAVNNFFGSAIDIDNGLVAVGAWARSIFFDHSGAAYVFDVASGSQAAYMVPSDGHDRDHFGNAISIHDGVVAIGAHQDGDNGWVAGSAYLYDALSGTQLDKLLASDGAQFDHFGSSIAIDNGVVAVGAAGDQDNGANSGSVYVYGSSASDDTDSDGVLDSIDNCVWATNSDQQDSDADGHGNACDADFNQDCIINFIDVGLFATHFSTVNALYDLNGDGLVNFIDYSVVVSSFLSAPGPGASGTCAN